MTKEEADAFCSILSAAETVNGILFVRQRPSEVQIADLINEINKANDFLVVNGVLCPECCGEACPSCDQTGRTRP